MVSHTCHCFKQRKLRRKRTDMGLKLLYPIYKIKCEYYFFTQRLFCEFAKKCRKAKGEMLRKIIKGLSSWGWINENHHLFLPNYLYTVHIFSAEANNLLCRF